MSASLLWTLIGVAGTAGLATGAVVRRVGLRRAYFGAEPVTAAASGLFAVPDGGCAVVTGVLYGAGFMIGGALLPLWSAALFSLVTVFTTAGARSARLRRGPRGPGGGVRAGAGAGEHRGVPGNGVTMDFVGGLVCLGFANTAGPRRSRPDQPSVDHLAGPVDLVASCERTGSIGANRARQLGKKHRP
ncbi:hypothetical protein [Amycolatopsis australiensis]|uniref:Uncharacterized protein n=1 Tax=Amycolatopsis australiensis TaxID=546364 RepID=A0A1K1S596_9PSEU|nr:hypothetical protein [Amycolatopsis australiensis]SFW79521.1 hypothetical protein SAMN04489730_4757 [Amycolatopsis australiensis]